MHKSTACLLESYYENWRNEMSSKKLISCNDIIIFIHDKLEIKVHHTAMSLEALKVSFIKGFFLSEP